MASLESAKVASSKGGAHRVNAHRVDPCVKSSQENSATVTEEAASRTLGFDELLFDRAVLSDKVALKTPFVKTDLAEQARARRTKFHFRTHLGSLHWRRLGFAPVLGGEGSTSEGHDLLPH